ncbi:hypothetical protein ACFFSH_04035 [Streptomyces filamentosus]|uniref:Lipoprotein n=1 Tax=Streptomyces filamentosus TaxID=67294 RepID=A0A919EIZ7_STRFL|nr:hypothetical protein [Streptomyces filamentosus]KAA6219567.1 hypothetical protein CP979_23750 [Streptomyces filamentosus]GHF85952.1 lipoprotein [Streptomyces filamentosus]
MRANRKLWAAATICLTATLALTGCGKGDDKPADPFAGLSADDIAKKSLDTTKAATSVHMKGAGKEDGKETTVDVTVDSKGSCQGTMSTTGEGKAEMVGTGGDLYIKGDDAFWTSSTGGEDAASEGPDFGKLLQGRWMKSPAEAAGADDSDTFCDLKVIFADMEKETKTTGLTRGADADVDGTPAVVLTGKDAKKGDTTLYVARDSAKPYVLRVVTTGGDDPGTVTLSDYDKPVTVTAPPADQVMDMEQLMKEALKG